MVPKIVSGACLHRGIRAAAWSLFSLILLAGAATFWPQSSAAQKPPRPQQLDKDTEYIRDPVTGELRLVPKRAPGSPAPPEETSHGAAVIRSEVRLVEIGCSAITAQGEPLHDLSLRDFRLAVNGKEQTLVHFDSSTEPAHIALVLDASPSEFHSLGEMKDAARALASELSPRDEVAMVAFAGHPHMLLPFTTDRKQLESSLDRIELMRSVEEVGSNIYGSVYLTAQRLFSGPKAPPGRKAILLLTDGQDSGLGLSWDPATMFPPPSGAANRLTFEDVVRELATTGVEVYIASTENRPAGMTTAWFAAHRDATLISDASRTLGIPAYTIYLAELVRRSGGALYFIREAGTLSEVYRRIAATLRTQYTLGFYPGAGADGRGWHPVAVGFSDTQTHAGARLDCRPSFYIPASQ